MVDDGLVLPTLLHLVELGDKNAPRTCEGCGDRADVYVFVTDSMASESDGLDVSEWPVNAMLCKACFRDAPRVESVSEIVDG